MALLGLLAMTAQFWDAETRKRLAFLVMMSGFSVMQYQTNTLLHTVDTLDLAGKRASFESIVFAAKVPGLRKFYAPMKKCSHKQLLDGGRV